MKGYFWLRVRRWFLVSREAVVAAKKLRFAKRDHGKKKQSPNKNPGRRNLRFEIRVVKLPFFRARRK